MRDAHRVGEEGIGRVIVGGKGRLSRTGNDL